jgi:hypothetical protein
LTLEYGGLKREGKTKASETDKNPTKKIIQNTQNLKSRKALDQFLGLEKALKMPHLPGA